jgi:hypothetical protein
MALRVVAWDDVANRLVRTSKDPANITVGSGGAIPDLVIAGSEPIANGQSFVDVTYVGEFSSTDYSIQANIINQVDNSPLLQPVLITDKSEFGFQAKWNIPVDSVNYRLDFYAVSPSILYRSNIESLNVGATEYATPTLAFNPALPFTYGLTNLVDTDPVYFSGLSKGGSQFTVSWGTPLETSNYILEWNAVDISAADRKSGTVGLDAGSTSVSVAFSFPQLASSTYALVARFENSDDPTAVHQPVMVTSKTLSGFTARWNYPLDSANYKLKWVLNLLF